MASLYLRNVPDQVVERLARLAAREGSSVSAFAIRELTDVSRRADNPTLLAELPDRGVDPSSLVEDVELGRAGR